MKGFPIVKGVVCLLIVAQLTGCGAIIHGRYQDLPVTTTPPGLMARIDDQKCTTPCTLAKVSRKTQQMSIALPDGREADFPVQRGVSAWVVLDVLFGFPIFIIMDKVSGGLYVLDPVTINLAEEKGLAFRVTPPPVPEIKQ